MPIFFVPILAAIHEDQWLLLELTGVVVLGIGAQWLAWRIRMPAILLLLVAGLVVGPGWAAVTGEKLLDPDALLGELLYPVVSLSVAIILFEGGLTLNISELRQTGGVLWRLVTVGMVATWVILTFAAIWILKLPVPVATLLGAILVVTGPTVIGPLLRFVRPLGGVGSLLKWEGIVIDPIGATLALLVFEVISIRGGIAGVALAATLRTGVVALVMGLTAAAVVVVSLRRFWVPDQLQVPLTFMMVVSAFAGSNVLQAESGLLAVTVMGIALANQRFVPVGHVLEFKETLSLLLIGALFILLGSRLQAVQIQSVGWRTVGFILVVLFVARPVSVLVSTVGTSLPWSQRIFLAWMAPRGIVAAAVASVFALRLRRIGVEGAAQIVPVTFAVIVATVSVYGLTAVWVAKRLGLSNPSKRGFLIAGANDVARRIAESLTEAGQEVLLVDTNRDNITAARMAGLNTFQGNILSEQLLRRIDGTGIGRLLALTPNSDVNSLAALHFSRHFGRSQIFQLPLPPASVDVDSKFKSDVSHELHGRRLFDRNLSYAHLAAAIAQGSVIKRTQITREFGWDALVARHAHATPMFIIDPAGQLNVNTVNNPIVPKPGQTVISLLREGEQPAPQATQAIQANQSTEPSTTG